mmetsp:Transcript_11107/g.18089  ORF Transcript_11107/g.18089 Transcript_11107/m.18089 type:complete len:439 (+) Transcript_11107:524-1840(+)|eukprot:CAMPEP_0201983080 /NCGR_PEP_ID=MMETSP0904-20121228/79158_1 /ASSEMBLY_ACC=CAM_ASM_000553 /TAXON_ID=420261 /ORGANISM="Thalassiosira antarctica, Strain CCMP982" /LENGTH=438 /DNA_ID=CAMNT_0048536103 /DNA_START=501 /DNA_END=1817 /DNA_ORIENTATION=-
MEKTSALPLPLLLVLLVALTTSRCPVASALSIDNSSRKTPSSNNSRSTSSRRDFLNGASVIAASAIIANPQPATAAPATRGRTICVTGANGYIGLHCVAQLLGAGYSVRAAVRSTSDDKTKYLTKVAADIGASDKLSFASIDLFDVDSMIQAGKGCDSMLHLASPFSLQPSSSTADAIHTIVEPAIAGAMNAVRAAESLGLQRLVTCGSIFGMVGSGTEKGFDHVYGSNDVNGFSTPKGCAYAYSKMASQQKSISLATERGVDLVTLNVGQVCGPALSPDQINPSWEPFRLLANPQPGGSVLSCTSPGFCDVRDVAAAHVAALGLPGAGQPRRYAVAARKESPTYVEIAELMADILPERNLPKKVDALPAAVQHLIVKGIGLGDKSTAELLEGATVPDGKTLMVDVDPMLKDLLPRPREVKTTLSDWLENQKSYGHVV